MDVFISYIEEDGATVRALAAELRALGHSTWTYEENGVAGISYLIQVHQAIEACQLLVLVASEPSVCANQVIREVEKAYERNKVIIPLRIGLTHEQFIEANPILRMATGIIPTLTVTDGVPSVAKRIAAILTFRRKSHVATTAETGPLPVSESRTKRIGRTPLRDRPTTQPALVSEPLPSVPPHPARQLAGKKVIFLSYRREDSADVAGRIYDRLIQAFEKTQVFKDVDSIPLGVDFRKHLQRTVEGCAVTLVVVGNRWLGAASPSGGRRIDDPKDFVRVEIEVALQRDIPVIPLLVHGAVLQESELPSILASLAYRNGTSIRPDPDFHRDMDRLIESLRTYVGGAART
jgi:hypothetical protein